MSCRRIDAAYLRGNPPPNPDEDGDKHSRGRVLVIAGSVQVPGAALLAGLGALRAGAGVLQIATCRSNSSHLGIAMPEAMVIGCRETADGEIDPSNAARLVELANEADAVLLGPGLMDETAVAELRAELMSQAAGPVYVLDASAFTSFRIGKETARPQGRRMIVSLTRARWPDFFGSIRKLSKRIPLATAQGCARQLQAVVVMKGGRTYEIDDFVPAEDIDERYLDKPYYIVPNGKAGADLCGQRERPGPTAATMT